MGEELKPIAMDEIAAEAARCRRILDEKPADEFSDMLYASYNTLLYVLGYGTAPPSECFVERTRATSVKGWRAQR